MVGAAPGENGRDLVLLDAGAEFERDRRPNGEFFGDAFAGLAVERVHLPDGLPLANRHDVDVVTVRQGKSVREMNAFDRQARKRIAEELAVGTPVTLELGSGVEEYQVAPILTWSRTDHGEPMVAEVEIDEVLFGNE